MKDYVYAIEFGDRLVKIGRSINPNKRAKNIATGSGRKIERIWVSEALINACGLERRAHEALAHCRGFGEWFNCSFDDAIKAISTEMLVSDSWTEERYQAIQKKSDEGIKAIIGLLKEAHADHANRELERFMSDFLTGMYERSIKNCITYLTYRDATEDEYWKAVRSEIAEADNEFGEMPEAGKEEQMQMAMLLAYSNEIYIQASRNEQVALGVVMESCMLVTKDVSKIPSMLEEIEVIARERMNEQHE